MNQVPQAVWRRPSLFLACGLGLGAMPWMPGTFGTFLGVLFYYLLKWLPLWAYLIVVVVLFVIGIGLCGIAGRELGEPDHSAIVFDEGVGFLVTMIAMPQNLLFVVMGFVLFRVFDIWKPWPIRWVERQGPAGFAVMADDVVAGIYAAVALWLIRLAMMV